MISYYVQIALQTIIMGIAIYFFIKALFATASIKAKTTWSSRVYNLFLSLVFLTAMCVTAFFWWDTIATDNTFFSKPMPKLVPIQQKR